MLTFKEYLNESVILNGSMVHTNMLEGYVKLFYKTLSKTTKGYKKPKNDSLFMLKGCGEIFDASSKTKIIDKRPFYTLTNQMITNYGKVFYTLEMDVDSSNVLIMYRDYKDKSKRDKYRLVMLAKKNIMNALKDAGFSVRSDRNYIYASLKDFVKNPSEDNGLVVLNSYQESLLNVAKKFFSFNGVFPASNRYALTLKQVTLLKDISDENNLLQYSNGSSFDRVVIATNGKIDFYRFPSDEEVEKTLYGCFNPITKDQKIEE
jgi:hypothetical protein